MLKWAKLFVKYIYSIRLKSLMMYIYFTKSFAHFNILSFICPFFIWFQHTALYNFKFPFTIDFHLSFTIGTWNTSLGPFWPNFGLMTSPRESKLQYSEKLISETNSSFQSSIKYWFQSFYHPWYIYTTFGHFYPIWR